MYGKTEGTVGFGASNRSIYHMEEHFERCGRDPWMQIPNWRNGMRFGYTGRTSGDRVKRTTPLGLPHQNMSNYTLEGRSNGGGKGPWMEKVLVMYSGTRPKGAISLVTRLLP